MNELTIINHNGVSVVDSREVAEMVGKAHKDLLENIRKHVSHLASGNFRPLDFFIEATYKDSKNESRPCYLLTRKGCDMIANKMTGEKGTHFTAAYVNKFTEMEKQISYHIDSYMIEDPIKRAEKWLEEQKAHQAEIKAKDEAIFELEESKGLNSTEVTRVIKNLKGKISSLINRNVFGNCSEYIIGKAKVLENFGVKKWEDIPSYKYYEVINYINKDLTL